MCRRKLGLVDRADKVAMVGAKVLLIVEMNGRYFIYDSQPDKVWVPPNAALVCWKHHNGYLVKVLTDKKERYYPLPERHTPEDIRQRREKKRQKRKTRDKC
jgi:hypothetical protein